MFSAKSQCKLGTIAHGHCSFLLRGLVIVQDTSFRTNIHGDSKLQSLSRFPIYYRLHKQIVETLNGNELKDFCSVTS